MRVLFVCLGNICRSPTAEGVMLALLEKRCVAGITVDSCGIVNHHVGDAPDPRTIEHARKRGYDLSSLRARQLAAEDFVVFDRIYCMDQANLRRLRDLAPPEHLGKVALLMDASPASASAMSLREVPDPWAGGPRDFERVLDLCEEACGALVDELAARQKRAS